MVSKTIVVRQSTWRKLKKLMIKKDAKDFDELLSMLVQKSEEIPPTMFGIDRKLRIKYTQKEHDEFVVSVT